MIPGASSLLLHLPHIVLVVGGVGVAVWFWSRQPPAKRAPSEDAGWQAEADRDTEERRRIRSSVAGRGLIALGPLIAAVATGAVLYGIDVTGGRPGGAAVWTHTGVSLLVVLLAVYKLAEVGLEPLREGLSPRRLFSAGASLLFTLLLVPLTITGVALLLSPSSASFAAYAHLVSSAWWTVLLLWHLQRYLAGSVATLRGTHPRVPASLR